MRSKYPNIKPSRLFDELFGTHISQEYEFPFRLTADEVWDIINENDDNPSEKFNIILENIDFPYLNMKSLPYMKKRDVIMGMVSCINSDDIVWYVQGNYGCSPESRRVEQQMSRILGEEIVQKHMGWVVSQNTFEKLINQLSVLAE
jgi:hypothetical protein